MEKDKEGLQTLTESKIQGSNTFERVSALLQKNKVTKEHVDSLPEEDIDFLYQVLSNNLSSLKGLEFDEFYEKVYEVVDFESKRQIWEMNHSNISIAISKLMKEFHRMPSKTEIAECTGLSRQTIHKHLKEYQQSPHYTAQLDQYRLMGANVLAAVYEEAFKGDIKAAKLYLQAIGWLNTGGVKTSIASQNNYIQVNGTVINEDALKQLPPEQLAMLSNMVRGVLLPPESSLNT